MVGIENSNLRYLSESGAEVEVSCTSSIRNHFVDRLITQLNEMSYAYLFKYIIIGDTGMRTMELFVVLYTIGLGSRQSVFLFFVLSSALWFQ